MTDEGVQPSVDFGAFDKAIEDYCAERFARGEPALVNALGIALGPQLRQVKAATGFSLTTYVKERLSDVYEIIRVKPNTDALWPRGEPYFEAVQRANQRLEAPRPTSNRFAPWLWSAFVVPPTEGKRRFYDRAHRRVVDAEEGHDTWQEIPAELLPTSGEPVDFREARSRIESWISAQGFDRSDFLAPPSLKPPADPQASLLDLVIATLDKRQLQTLSLPLDVVEALAKRRP